jgi:hypothetical protein
LSTLRRIAGQAIIILLLRAMMSRFGVLSIEARACVPSVGPPPSRSKIPRMAEQCCGVVHTIGTTSTKLGDSSVYMTTMTPDSPGKSADRSRIGSEVSGVHYSCVSKISSPSGNSTQGCLFRVQTCVVGRSHDVSSSVPPRTIRWLPGGSLPNLGPPHLGISSAS